MEASVLKIVNIVVFFYLCIQCDFENLKFSLCCEVICSGCYVSCLPSTRNRKSIVQKRDLLFQKGSCLK